MHEQPRELFTQTLFIGVDVFWGGFCSLEQLIPQEFSGVTEAKFIAPFFP